MQKIIVNHSDGTQAVYRLHAGMTIPKILVTNYASRMFVRETEDPAAKLQVFIEIGGADQVVLIRDLVKIKEVPKPRAAS